MLLFIGFVSVGLFLLSLFSVIVVAQSTYSLFNGGDGSETVFLFGGSLLALTCVFVLTMIAFA